MKNFFMKKSTILMRLLSAIMTASIAIMALVSNSCLIPCKAYASSESGEILDSESDGSESKSVNKDNNDNRVLDCKYTVHRHGSDCYDDDNNVICGYADFVVHTHDKNCYDNMGKLVCKLPEITEHTHSEECYGGTTSNNIENNIEEENPQEADEGEEDMGDMIIIMEEPIPLDEENLICHKKEIQLHTHTMICLGDDGSIICGKLEVASHQHTEGCFKEVKAAKKELKTTNSVKQQTAPQTDINTIPQEANAQVTENPKTESGSMSWGVGVFGIITLILAVVICRIIYKKNRRV
jgi:hypothetical protein